jgi:hypothetical protein
MGGALAPVIPDEVAGEEVRAVAAVLAFLTAEGLNHPWGDPPPGMERRERLPFRVAPIYLVEGERRLVDGRSLEPGVRLRNVTDQLVDRGAEFAAEGPVVVVRDCTDRGCIGQGFDMLPTEVLAVERPGADRGELELMVSFIQVHWSDGDLVTAVGATTVRVKVAGHRDPAGTPTVELLTVRETTHYLS